MRIRQLLQTRAMKNVTLAALIAFAASLSVASAATTVTSTTTTVTRAQMHTQNNLNRYSKKTMNNLSRYSRVECAKHKGVMVKQQNGKLVCVAKMR